MSQETYVSEIPGPPFLDARLLRSRRFFLKAQRKKSAWGCFLSVRWLAKKSWCSSTWVCVTSISTFITVWHSPCMYPIFPFVWVMERHLDWIIYKDLLSKVTPVHGAERLESRPFWKKHKATYTGSETVKDNGELVKRLQDKQVKQGVVYKPQILPGTLPVSRSRTCFRNSLLIH